MIDLPGPLAVVCHDAGAANLILPWIDAASREDIRPVMKGPAEQLWQHRFGERPLWELEQALNGAAAVLTGTGWASDSEHEARRLASRQCIWSAAVVDHWVNYRERFLRHGETLLPDEIWVTDGEALALVAREIPERPARLMPNLYLQEQLARTPALSADDRDVVFVSEPMRSDWGRGMPGEFQALDYFLASRPAAGVPEDAPVRVRPHPSERIDKYDNWSDRLQIDLSSDLADSLTGARWVVGCESYALVVALEAGRTVISALPPWARPCRLPHEGIIHLSRL